MAKTLEQIQAELEALKTQFNDFSALSPVSYYTHQYSGEEIDDSVGVTQNTVPTLVRPNLLDNWYFGHPVNQRGKEEYSGAVYGIDRWKGQNATHTLSIIDGGVTAVDSNGGTWLFRQVIDDCADFSGKTVTASLLSKKGLANARVDINYITSAGEKNVYGNYAEMSTATVTLPEGITRFWFVVSCASKATCNLIACKLELGDTQTLAHKEGGKWVLNEVPDYGEQLRRCQRYAVETNQTKQIYTIVGIGVARNTMSISAFVALPAPMRALPTLMTTLGNWIVVSGDEYINVTTASVSNITPSGIELDISVAKATNGKAYILLLANSATALFSADL